jgi:hypothetical protein
MIILLEPNAQQATAYNSYITEDPEILAVEGVCALWDVRT